MKRILGVAAGIVPFAAVVSLAVLDGLGIVPSFRPVVAMMAVLLACLLADRQIGDGTPTTPWVGGITLVCLAVSLFIPSFAGVFLAHPAAFGIYGALFLMAVLPPLAGNDPFTLALSKGDPDESAETGASRRRVHLVVTGAWALLFAGGAVLSVLDYGLPGIGNVLLGNALPAAAVLALGLPAHRFLPGILSSGKGA